MRLLHGQDFLAPGGKGSVVIEIAFLQFLGEKGQGPAQVPFDAQIDIDDFVDFDVVDFKMDDLGVRCKSIGPAGQAFVEAGA